MQAILLEGFKTYNNSTYVPPMPSDDCDCGTTMGGRYLGKLGGQLGDRGFNAASHMLSGFQKRFKDWTGLGDYKLISNSLVPGGGSDYVQSIHSDGRWTIVKYREFLGDITTHPTVVGQFDARSYMINPGNVLTFPWVSGLALQYEQWKPLGILFEFKSTCSDSSTTSALGSILMATEYDITDPVYPNKTAMVNSAYSSESKMCDNALHGIECDPREANRNIQFVRVGANANLLAGTSADRDYDMARFTIATSGGALATKTVVGSLYVNYEFAFLKEQVQVGVSTVIQQRMTGMVIPVPPAAYNLSALGNTVSGVDMGIRFLTNATRQTDISIPRALQGMRIWVCFSHRSFGLWTPFSPSEAWQVNTACSFLTQGGSLPSVYGSVGFVNGTGRISSSAAGFATAQTNNASLCFMMLMPSVMSTDVVLELTSTGTELPSFPTKATGLTDTLTSGVTFTIVPATWEGSLT
jgi:hypothetical protein